MLPNCMVVELASSESQRVMGLGNRKNSIAEVSPSPRIVNIVSSWRIQKHNIKTPTPDKLVAEMIQ